MKSDGEPKVISVLFADVANYSSMAEQLDPEVVHNLMDAYFRTLTEIVDRYGGVVQQLLGDGMLVFFGAPLAHEDHALRACHSSLEMQKATRKFSKLTRSQYGIDFRVRIGINSGPVFAGPMGSELHREYLAVGTTTNLASRIQNAASPGQILVSASTYHLSRSFFNFEAESRVAIKGREQPIEAHQLRRANKAESRFDAANYRGLSRFCGRESELDQLTKLFFEVEQGQGRVVDVTGEPGIGKSRLIREFRQDLAPGKGAFLEGRCLHYGNSIPYRPVIDVLRAFFEIEQKEPESRAKQKIRMKVKQIDETLVSDLPFIYELLSFDVEDKGYFNVAPEHRKNKMFSVAAGCLAAASLNKPIVVVIEDLHWIDDISQELLSYLVRRLENNRVLFLLSYRPGFTPPWKEAPGYLRIHLGQLGADSSRELLLSLLPGGELASELESRILTRAEGNPLFVEEFTFGMLEEGLISSEEGRYSLIASSRSGDSPDTLNGIIASRIDRLPGRVKTTLQAASAAGKDFKWDVLRTVLTGRKTLDSQLEMLEDLELVVQTTIAPGEGYAFKHALIQEVAYRGMSSKMRQQIHEKLGKAFEKLYRSREEEYLDLLAYHFRHGLSADKALDYCIRAGNKARAAFANQAAIGYYTHGLELCPEFGSVGEAIGSILNESLCDIYVLTGEFDRAWACIEVGDELGSKFEESRRGRAAELGNRWQALLKHLRSLPSRQERLAKTYFGKSEICAYRRMASEGLEWAEKGLALVGISDLAKARLFAVKSNFLLQRGEYDLALESSQKAQEYAHNCQDEIEASALCTQGYIHNQTGGDRRTTDCFERALEVSIRLGKPASEAEALDSLAIAYNVSGDWKNAETYYRKSLAISQRIGATALESRTLTNYSDLLIRRGRPPEIQKAIDWNIRALELRGRSGTAAWSWVTYANVAWASIKLGKMQQAREFLHKAQACLEAGFSSYWHWQGDLMAGEVHFACGETEVALDYCRKALGVVIETKSTLGEGQVRLLMGRIYASLGRWNEAVDALQSSLSCLENTTSPPDERALARWNLAIVHREMKQSGVKSVAPASIRELAAGAVEIWRKLEMSYDEGIAAQLLEA